jgi:hypothetical protein
MWKMKSSLCSHKFLNSQFRSLHTHLYFLCSIYFLLFFLTISSSEMQRNLTRHPALFLPASLLPCKQRSKNFNRLDVSLHGNCEAFTQACSSHLGKINCSRAVSTAPASSPFGNPAIAESRGDQQRQQHHFRRSQGESHPGSPSRVCCIVKE